MKSVIKQIAVLFLIAHVVLTAQVSSPKPSPAPARWLGLIGEYGPDNDILYILEKDAKLCASFKRAEPEPLHDISRNVFAIQTSGPQAN